MNIKQLYKLYTQNFLIDTDTRTLRNGSIFFALKGDSFNGNKFAETALKNGSTYAIIDEKEFQTNSNIILVNDTLETLQQLANYHRRQLNIPIIAVTGSNGKTTTKELINTVLSKKYKTKATKGNLNNHIGVPLTLLSMDNTTEIGIVEMGANHIKEIEILCKIAEPNYGYITNFGKAHLEGFGGFEGVIQGKSELYEYLKKNKGKAFINSDDTIQKEKSKGNAIVEFNSKTIKFIEAKPFVEVEFKNNLIKSQLIGKYNYSNIAAAIKIGSHFNVAENDIVQSIKNYIPTNNRSQIIEKDSNKIILDAYNANPSSMKVSLESFSKLIRKQKVVFLGDMFELGESSKIEHQKIAELASSFNFNKLYLIGKAFATTSVKNAFIYDSFESFKTAVDLTTITNSSILIKGSRGMALERILTLL